MATFNFKATEDDRPGGGVYKIGAGTAWTIRQSDYPNVNLASMNANNFFLSCTKNGSGTVYMDVATNRTAYYQYTGASAGSIQCSYSGGTMTVRVVGGSNSKVSMTTYEAGGGGSQYTSCSYVLYMSRTAIS